MPGLLVHQCGYWDHPYLVILMVYLQLLSTAEVAVCRCLRPPWFSIDALNLFAVGMNIIPSVASSL